MKFEIKSWINSAILFSWETESLKLCVEAAIKSGANLSGAYLSRAYLSRAYLSRAYLSSADLSGAKGIDPNRCTPLLLLLEQPEKIRAYKLVNADSKGPYCKNNGFTPIKYQIGKIYKVFDADTDINKQCSMGISLATLDWCMKEWQSGYRILIAEFTAKDIAAIPTATEGLEK